MSARFGRKGLVRPAAVAIASVLFGVILLRPRQSLQHALDFASVKTRSASDAQTSPKGASRDSGPWSLHFI